MTMNANVAQLLKEPIGSTRSLEVLSEEAGIYGQVQLTRTDRGILVTGRISAPVDTSCSRCLSPFACPVTFRLDEEFYPTVDVVTGMPLPQPEDADSFTIDENHMLDLYEAVRQYALLALPMKPLCKQDCPGICSRCGENLNDGPCSCPKAEKDQRWAKLEALLSDDSESAARDGRPAARRGSAK